jgi:hypothetical protein
MQRDRIALIAGLCCLATLACSKPEEAASAPAAAPAAPAAPAAEPAAAKPAEAPAAAAPAAALDPKEVFKTRCVMCHGESGHGDGAAAAALTPKPRNYTDAAWQKSVTDDDIKKVIAQGGAAVGKSPLMPAQPDLAQNQAVLDGLVKIIRGFASAQ